MIRESELVKRLQAHIELKAMLSIQPGAAEHIIKVLAPKILSIVREERAEERRAKVSRECQL